MLFYYKNYNVVSFSSFKRCQNFGVWNSVVFIKCQSLGIIIKGERIIDNFVNFDNSTENSSSVQVTSM